MSPEEISFGSRRLAGLVAFLHCNASFERRFNSGRKKDRRKHDIRKENNDKGGKRNNIRGVLN